MEWEWVLEEFDRKSGLLRNRYRLSGLADSDALTITGLDDLGDADLYNVPDASLSYLAARFGLTIIPSNSITFSAENRAVHPNTATTNALLNEIGNDR
jgi:hypothetical protein